MCSITTLEINSFFKCALYIAFGTYNIFIAVTNDIINYSNPILIDIIHYNAIKVLHILHFTF